MKSRFDGSSSEDESLDNDKKSASKSPKSSNQGMFAKPSGQFIGAVMDNGVHLRWNTLEEFMADLEGNKFNNAKVVSKEQFEGEQPHHDGYEDRARPGF